MAPTAVASIPVLEANEVKQKLIPPAPARARLDKAGIDWQKEYPLFPVAPKYVHSLQYLQLSSKV